MRRASLFVAGVSVFSLVFAFSALAQERARTGDDDRQVIRASSVIGYPVKNAKGENLGKIEELVLDPQGRIAYAVLSFGGFLGLGDKYFALPWSALQLNAREKHFLLNVDKDQLKVAPGFNKDNWPNMASPQWAAEVHRFYGTRPYGEEVDRREGRDTTEALVDSRKIEAENVSLSLKLEKGKTYIYTLGTGEVKRTEVVKPDAEVKAVSAEILSSETRIHVEDTSFGGDATLHVTFSPAFFEKAALRHAPAREAVPARDGAPMTRTVTVIVGKDGIVKSITESQTAPTEPSRAAAASGFAYQDHLRAHLQGLFGAGLHSDKLEVGKIYNVLTAGWAGRPAADPTTGPDARESVQTDRPDKERREIVGKGEAWQKMAGIRFRYEGKFEDGGQQYAYFTVIGSGADYSRTTNAAGERVVPASSRDLNVAGASRREGDCYYRIKDGLLEKANVGGCSILRTGQ